MLVARERALLKFSWIDRDENIAATIQYVPHLAPLSAIEAAAALWLSRTELLSDASPIRYQVLWTWEDTGPLETGEFSDVLAKMAMFYRNENRWASFWVPGARAELLEQEGNYRDVRLAADREDVAPVLLAFQDVIDFMCLADETPFPNQFVVAGRAL